MRDARRMVLVIMLAATSCITGRLMAQERAMEPEPQSKIRENERTKEDGLRETLSNEQEKTGRQAVVASTDSLAIIPSKTGENQTKNERAGTEDLVSFNFLYYIIQRYKMSDIVDQ